MQFIERKQFAYDLEDVFGIMVFISPKKLDADTLDAIFMAVFKAGGDSMVETMEGEINVEDYKVTYTFTKKKTWDVIPSN